MEIRPSRALLLAAQLSLLLPWVAPAAESENATVVVERLPLAPTLDGRLDRREGWPRALRVPLDGSDATQLRLGWHGRWLYLGLRAPLPPAGLLQRAQPRERGDALSVLDDSLELWLGGASPDAPLARIIVNANDAIWDAQYRVDGDAASPLVDWSSGAQSASLVDADAWSLELRVPLPEGAAQHGARVRTLQRKQRPEREHAWPSRTDPAHPASGLARVGFAERRDPSPEASAIVPAAAPAGCNAMWREAAAAADFRIAWFPYPSKLRLRLDLSAVPGAEHVATAQVSLRRDGSSSPGWTHTLALQDRSADVVRELPELADGVYEVAVEFPLQEGCDALEGPRRRFEQRRFGWEHNDLGRGDAVIPPFTPLRVSGRSVRAVLREYRLNDLGLPDQITSVGEDLLAAPATFRVRTGGRDRQPVPEHPIRIERESEGRVRSEADWRAGGLRVRSVGAFEMDGMWRIDLEISGSDEQVERLDLVIPLRDERGTLFNAITDAVLHHTLGETPAGQGAVWDSLAAGRWAFGPDFVPYLWVGDEERGLAWFADSRSDWWLTPGRPAQELVRRRGVLELVVHLAAGPGQLRGTRRISFGLQATPAKPRPERPRSWRTWQLVCRSSLSVFRLCPLGSGLYWGSETPYGNPYPRGREYSLLQHLGRVRRGDAADASAVDAWLDAQGVRDGGRKLARNSLRHALSAAAARPEAIAFYVNLHGSAWTPEFAVYQDEWRSEPFGDRVGADANHTGEIKIRSSASWNDYVLWHLDRLLETGATDGFFFDNTYLKADFNEIEGSAHRDERGALHPGVDLFSMRELLKRAQILTYRRRGAWLNVAHMTMTPIVPIQTWAGVSVGGEAKYGTDDYQDRFPREQLRAASLGAQAGTVSAYLPGLKGTPGSPEWRRLERGLAGVTAVHEIRVVARMEGAREVIWRAFSEFGYGKPGTAVLRYWDRDRGFRVSGADAEALVLARGGRALALLVSFGEAGDVELRFDARDGPLGALRPGGVCSDVEGRTPAPRGSGRGCRVRLARHDFRLIAYGPPGSTQ